jgi:hypothetical protein
VACGLDLFEVLEHAAVELDVIRVAEIGNDVMPESGSKRERVGPVSTAQPVVAVAADQAVTTIASEQEIIAAPAVERLPLVAAGDDAVAVAADKTVGEHHRLAGVAGHDGLDLMPIEVVDDAEGAGPVRS